MKKSLKKTTGKYILPILFSVLIGVGAYFILTRLIFRNSLPQSPDALAQSIKLDCTKYNKKGGKFACYGNIFYNLAMEKGHARAFDILLALQKIDPVTVQCHLIAHEIGRGAYEHNRDNWRSVIVESNKSCSYGVVHGVIEKYLSSLSKGHISDNNILLNICDKKNPTGCNHIIGHLLMVEYKGNVERALEKCKIFSDKKYIQSCSHGVFMEHVEPRILVDHGLADKSLLNLSTNFPDLVKLCDKYLEDSNFTICWGRLARAAMFKFNYDAQAVLDFCDSTTKASAAKDCRGSAINNFTIHSNLNLSATKSMCKLEPSIADYEGQCYNEIASTAIGTLSMADSSRVVDFCSSLESRFQGECYARIGITLKNRVSDQDLAKICSIVPEKYHSQCAQLDLTTF